MTCAPGRILELVSLLACCAAPSLAQPCEPMWIAGDPIPGVNGRVLGTTLWDRDGVGPGQPLIVAVGEFTIAGDQFASNVATFDPATQRWSRCRDGVNAAARSCAAIRNAAGGEDLIVGGDFTVAGGVAVQHLARFDGARWHDVGGGVSAPVRALAAIPLSATASTLYVGGGFTTSATIPASYLVQWDGTTWSGLGSGVNGRVNQLSVATNASGGQDLIVTGDFPVWSRAAFSRVAVWSGGAWIQTPQPGPGGPEPEGVAAIGWPRTSSGYDVIAGAIHITSFNTIDYYTMRWSGSSWQSMHGTNSLLRSRPSAFAVVRQGLGRPALYSSIGSAVVRENGTGWVNAGASVGANCMMPVPVTPLTDDLVIGGSFRSLGGSSLLRFSSGVWTSLGKGLDSPVTRLARIRDSSGSWRLVAAGRFRDPVAGTSCLAYSSGGPWSWLGGLVNGEVRAMLALPQASGSDHLIIAGDFTTIGGAPIAHLALWDGVSWSSIGTGSFGGGGPVCLVLHPDGAGGNDLIVGGTFTSIGSVAANRIARWDGASWHAIGNGFSFGNTGMVPSVTSLASVPLSGGGAELYAAGTFDRSGTASRSSICRWNGTSWDDLGGGLGGVRWPFASSAQGPPVYANFVRALETVPRSGGGADLIVAGIFNSAGGMPVRRIARWDGAAWNAMGLGLGPASSDIFQSPLALAHMPNMQGGWDVFAAGLFTTADGLPAKRIARWDGAQWHDVDGGFDAEVHDLLVLPRPNGRSELLAAGDFVQAGAAVSCRIAAAICPTPICKADLNGDFAVDFFDYLEFLDAFTEGSQVADFNDDADIDFFDYLDFVSSLSLGC